MIKIFGQLRYHWQPDLSLLIIYWSLSVIPIFILFVCFQQYFIEGMTAGAVKE